MAGRPTNGFYAACCADFAAGLTNADIQRNRNVKESTVRAWRKKYDVWKASGGDPLKPFPHNSAETHTDDDAELDAVFKQSLIKNLRAQNAIADLLSDPTFLRKHGIVQISQAYAQLSTTASRIIELSSGPTQGETESPGETGQEKIIVEYVKKDLPS